MGGAEEGDPQGFAEAFEAMAQGGQRSVAVEPLAQCLKHPMTGLLAVQGLHLAPDLRLGGANEGQRLLGKDGALAVKGLAIYRGVTSGEQLGLDHRLKGGF